MSEWLDIMLAEIARKFEEEKNAVEEAAKRKDTAVKTDSSSRLLGRKIS
jgi:hypothetical protein